MPRGGGQALEGAPAQLVGVNFKKKIMPRQIRKVTSLQCRINPVAKVVYATGAALSRALRPLCIRGSSYQFLVEDPFFSFFFFFLLVDFFHRAKGFVFTKGGAPTV